MRQLTWVGVVAATCVAVSYIANAEPKKEKLVPLPVVLRSLETNQAITLVNPKEVTVDKAVSWTKSKNSKDDAPELEFTDSEPKTLACELLFDMFEERGNVYNTFVQPIEFQVVLLQVHSVNQLTKRIDLGFERFEHPSLLVMC